MAAYLNEPELRKLGAKPLWSVDIPSGAQLIDPGGVGNYPLYRDPFTGLTGGAPRALSEIRYQLPTGEVFQYQPSNQYETTYSSGGVFKQISGAPYGGGASERVEDLIASGQYRDVPGSIISDYYAGRIGSAEAVAKIKATPVYNPSIGPIIDYGRGKIQTPVGTTGQDISNIVATAPALPDVTRPDLTAGNLAGIPIGQPFTYAGMQYVKNPAGTVVPYKATTTPTVISTAGAQKNINEDLAAVQNVMRSAAGGGAAMTGGAAPPATKQISIPKDATLSGFAAQYGTTVDALMKLNPQIKDPDLIYAGDMLTVPMVSVGGVSAVAPPAPQAKPVLDIAPTNAAQGSIINEINNLLQNPNVIAALPESLRNSISQSVNAITAADRQTKSLASAAQTAYDNNNLSVFGQIVEQMKNNQIARDNLITQMQNKIAPLREKYVSSLVPTEEEKNLQQQLNDIVNQQRQYEIDLRRKKEAQYGMGRVLGVSERYATKEEKEASFARQEMSLKEIALTQRLGLLQDARKFAVSAAEFSLKSALDDRDFAMKVNDAQETRENRLFSIAESMSKEQRYQLADMLDVLKNTDPSTWSPDTQSNIAQLAASRGLSFDVVKDFAQTNYDKNTLDMLYKSAQIESQERDNLKVFGTDERGYYSVNVDTGEVKRLIAGVPTTLRAADVANTLSKVGIPTSVANTKGELSKTYYDKSVSAGIPYEVADGLWANIIAGNSLETIKNGIIGQGGNPAILDKFIAILKGGSSLDYSNF